MDDIDIPDPAKRLDDFIEYAIPCGKQGKVIAFKLPAGSLPLAVKKTHNQENHYKGEVKNFELVRPISIGTLV